MPKQYPPLKTQQEQLGEMTARIIKRLHNVSHTKTMPVDLQMTVLDQGLSVLQRLEAVKGALKR